MSLEDSISKLTAALEAATGALIAASAKAGAAPAAAAPAAAPATPAKRGPGRPPAKAAETPPADSGDGGLGGDELGGDDGGLGGDDGGLGGELTVTPEEAKAAVLAYRDKAIKVKGKDAGLAETRALMNKFVKSLDAISAENAAAVAQAFNDAIAKLK